MTSGVFTIPLISTDRSGGDSSENFVTVAQHRHFIAGPENLLLQSLSDTVSTRPPLFNPITLYGPTGVGKSHLLHGLVERHKTLTTESPVTFLTGADFGRGLARAIEVDSVAEWREKQRNVDLFVLDDLQELASKPAAQQELLHTLDMLVDQDRQLILASRLAPLDWNWMSPGLRSRIEGGLIIPVAPPGAETQRHILRELVATHGLPPDAEFTLPIRSNPLTYPQVRQSVLQHLQCLANPTSISQNLNAASQKGSLPRIAKLVARQSQVKLSDLLGPSRRQSIVRARGVAIYLARTLLRLSFDKIGQYFGDRDHTTVLHSWRQTKQRLETDARFKHEVNKLTILLADNFEIQQP